MSMEERQGRRAPVGPRARRVSSASGGPRAPGTVSRLLREVGLAIVAAGVLVACGPGGAADGQGSADGESASEVGSAQTSQEAAGADTTATTARSSDTTELTVDGVTITAEVADEDAERQRGLMNRDSLPDNHGMLFVYPEERTLSFWMRDTRIPLDIAFLDSRGNIVDIQQMEPQSDEQHRSAEPAMYALEMRQGWFADHGIEVGARVSF